MPVTTSFKVCPQCTQPAVLDMQRCQRCGHVYQSQHVPINQTQVFTGPMPRAARVRQPNTRTARIALCVGAVLGVLAVGGWMLLRWMNPYPFLGEWVSGSGDQAGTIMCFKRNGSVTYLSISLPTEWQPNGNRSQTEAEWHADGDRLLIGANPPEHWSVSDDGQVLTLTGKANSDTVQFFRRSALRFRPTWLPQ